MKFKELVCFSCCVVSSNINCSHSEMKTKQLNFGTKHMSYWVDSLVCCNQTFSTGLWSEHILPCDNIYTCKLIICIPLCCGCKTHWSYICIPKCDFEWTPRLLYFIMLFLFVCLFCFQDHNIYICCAIIWLIKTALRSIDFGIYVIHFYISVGNVQNVRAWNLDTQIKMYFN